jgi:hypothetical protein
MEVWLAGYGPCCYQCLAHCEGFLLGCGSKVQGGAAPAEAKMCQHGTARHSTAPTVMVSG